LACNPTVFVCNSEQTSVLHVFVLTGKLDETLAFTEAKTLKK